MPLGEEYPVYGPFFGVMGAASAIIFSGKFISTEKANGRTLQIFTSTKICQTYVIWLM